MENKKVILDKKGIYIDGEPEILVCASLFYFRIPSELWHDRIKKLKKIGYNCVDVYFPWNYHEIAPGKWDFSAQKDIEGFLELLSEEEMYVVARPGPYICSEWDGGAIPAWVLDDNLAIREADRNFLEKVEEWYSKVLPKIARYQYGQEGTVIMLQLENELDFFDCSDPGKYMSELKNMAIKYGIEVPLVGCAGQGSIERATGCADGVEPTYNFYPSPSNRDFDYQCYIAYETMKRKGKPLLVTETNRDYFTLRRELACGAKLISPYNQVAGTNFGFTNGINNWGNDEFPLSLITSDYNFASDISAAGEYSENVLEGRLFTSLIKSLGPSLALSRSVMDHGFEIRTDFVEPKYGFAGLELEGGGWLICIPNISDRSGIARISDNDIEFSVNIGAFQAPFLPIKVSLDRWGIDGMLEWSSAEIGPVYSDENEIKFILYSDSKAEACLNIPDTEYIEGCKPQNGKVILSKQDKYFIGKQNNKRIHVLLVDREYAARLEPDLSRWSQEIPSRRKSVVLKEKVSISKIQRSDIKAKENIAIANLEKYGLWRGYAIYEISSKYNKPVLLKGVADIVSAYKNGEYLDTRISGGQWQRYEHTGTGSWSFRTEIWGHSNFDDSRLNSTRLQSGKGICGAFEIIMEEDVSDCWAFDYFDGDITEELEKPLTGIEPLLSPNSWNSTRVPVKTLYRRQICLREDCDSAILHVEGNQALSYIYVNGEKVDIINPLDPFIDISSYMRPGEEAELAIAAIKRSWNEPVGNIELIHCKKIEKCNVCLVSDRDIISLLKKSEEQKYDKLPMTLKPGEVKVLSIDADKIKKGCAYLYFEGGDIKLTVSFNDKVVGRIILNDDKLCNMVGGDADRCYIPGPWFKPSENQLNILLEAIGDNPSIGRLTMEYV